MEQTSRQDDRRPGAERVAAAPARARRRARLAAVRRRVSSVMRRWADKGESGGSGGPAGGDSDGGEGPDSRLIHDLRMPLTSIRSFSEILRQHPELSYRQRTRYLDIILSEGRRLERAIEAFESRTGPDPAR
ncbi:MAG: histidine kinase dimerization/phospho-acceptor domain-containing protein [Kiloniellales bacterium]|nr:histidine kinase dimerization/phospho-acceptor domain-containing protein [Kiloniellales bacterium]